MSIDEYLILVSAVEDSNWVDTFATKLECHMVTNEPMLTRICVENMANIPFECDMAASHSIL